METFWKGMWVTLVWNVWKHKNEIVFQNSIANAEHMFCEAQIKM